MDPGRPRRRQADLIAEAQRRAEEFNVRARNAELEADIVRLRALLAELLLVVDHEHDEPVAGCDACGVIERAQTELRKR
jgi:hypothetical protein